MHRDDSQGLGWWDRRGGWKSKFWFGPGCVGELERSPVVRLMGEEIWLQVGPRLWEVLCAKELKPYL